MKFPKFSQWKQLFKVLKGPERISFLILILFACVSASFLIIGFYFKNTVNAPAYAGAFTEGVVGQPRFINPIYGDTNDIDRTLIGLIYSGLFTYDKDGKLTNDLIKSYTVSDNGETYAFQLKDNLFWQDGLPLTSDDVIFTIKTIQNSDYKSPLRANWLNVEAQKQSDKTFTLSLGSPYNSFLENCTARIIPQHIWRGILPENFALSPYNLQPIGSGPFMLKSLEQTNTGFIKNLKLAANPRYYNKKPYLQSVNFQFFGNKEDLVKAANQKTIDGFSLTALNDSHAEAEKEIHQGWSANEKFSIYSFSMPRYFAVFFNTQDSKILSDANIAKALNYGINKQELVQKISDLLKEKVNAVSSPVLPEYFGFAAPENLYNMDLEAAGKLLDKSGFKDNGTGIRSKANDKKPAFQFKSYLKQGSKGTEVTELQGCLTRIDASFKDLLAGETTGKYGKGTEDAITAFQKKYLPDMPSTGEVGAATRKKLNELCLGQQSNSIILQLTLTTINQPQMVQTANLLRDYWQKIGVAVNIKTVELSELKDIIKNRDYDALLYGEALGSLPDLYPFWHSTQIKDPGLNLSKYQNKKADQLLKDARETMDPETKAKKYEELQNIILNDAPAVFLYNPDYIYWVSQKIKGVSTAKIIDPAKRFESISNWYINTHRVWK